MRSLPDAILVSTWLHFGTKKLSKSHLGSVLGRLRRVLRRLGGVSERIGGVLGRLGAILDASWAILEASWAVLEASLARPEGVLGTRPRRRWGEGREGGTGKKTCVYDLTRRRPEIVKPNWSPSGSRVGSGVPKRFKNPGAKAPKSRSGSVLGRLGVSWSVLVLWWGVLGASWGHLGPSWKRPGSVLGRFECVWDASWGVLGASWPVLWASRERLGASLGVLGASCA